MAEHWITVTANVIGKLRFPIQDGTFVDLDRIRTELPDALRLEYSALQLCIEINEHEAGGLQLIPHEHGEIQFAEVVGIEITEVLNG